MYPVGVLFGFGLWIRLLCGAFLKFFSGLSLGFDTASSIALLAVTALAQRDAEGKAIPREHIVILPVCIFISCTLRKNND